jgi:hypothetical protein
VYAVCRCYNKTMRVLGVVGFIISFSSFMWIAYSVGQIQNLIKKAEHKIEPGEERLKIEFPTNEVVLKGIKDIIPNINYALLGMALGTILLIIGIDKW